MDNSRILTASSSVAMLVTGGLLATTQPESLMALLGAILIALGSALLSVALSEIKRLEQAQAIIAPQVEPICYQFLAAISQLRQATKDFRDATIGDETAAELIAAHTSNLEEALRNLYAYTGVSGDRDKYHKRRQQTQIDEEQPRLAHVSASTAEQTSRTARPDESRDLETVACPNCGTEHSVLLGRTVGDSATSSCRLCHLRFHVHRDRHGDAYTKPYGSGSKRNIKFWCPSCAQYEFRYSGDAEPRYCLECFALVEPVGDSAQIRAPSVVPGAAVSDDIDGAGKRILICDHCNSRTKSFILYKNYLWAVCIGCRSLIRATVSSEHELPFDISDDGAPADGLSDRELRDRSDAVS
jgi:hypothetical protein